MMVLRRMSMLGGASSAMFLNMRSANCLSTECAPGKLRATASAENDSIDFPLNFESG